MWKNKIVPPIHVPPSTIGYLLPITTLFMVLIGFIYYIYLIQKGKLSLNETVIWIIFTLFMVFISIYLLILQIMSTFDVYGFNIFNYFASLFGLINDKKVIPGWLVFIILIFIAYIYAKIFHSALKISKLRKNIGTLSKEIAIINGKLADHLKEKHQNTDDKENEDKLENNE